MRTFKIILLYPLMFICTALIAVVVGIVAFMACLIDLPYQIAAGIVDEDDPENGCLDYRHGEYADDETHSA